MSYKWNTSKAIDHCKRCAELELWCFGKGYFLVRGWAKRNDAIQIEIYGYKRPSYHLYSRAQDYTLFIKLDNKIQLEIDGENIVDVGGYAWITDGNHPIWKEIADKAEELGLRSGRDWEDINHVETE